MQLLILSISCTLLGLLAPISCSRVLELSDKFIELSKEGQWLVKFYAPWCAHCKRIEPVWAHVAQNLFSSPVRVAKVDCTRFTNVATHFNIKAFPTILFIKGKLQHEYLGERTRDDLVNYALRMSTPPIQQVTMSESIEYLRDLHPVFFGYIGDQVGTLWELFRYHAVHFQPHVSFYSMQHHVAKRDIKTPNESHSIFVYKDNQTDFFPYTEEHLKNRDNLNETLKKWINAERFGTYPKVTRSNIHQIMEIDKYIVLAVVEENKINKLTESEQKFKDMIEKVIRSRKKDLHHTFQFGWIGSPDLANSIAMSALSIPHLIVLNSTTSHHHLPQDDPVKMTDKAVQLFLEQIANNTAPVYGGNSWGVRVWRAIFTARSSLVDMWRGNPVLTSLIFGLPLGFLSLICYSICCADILEADEEDDSQDDHEKKE